MIRILHTIDTTGPGGAEKVFLNLVRGLDRRSFLSTVAIPGEGWVHDELVTNGFSPIFLRSKGSFSVRYLCQIISIIKRYKIDIIQSHLIGSNVYCSLAGILCRIPVISTIHGFVDMDIHDRLSMLRFFLINHGSKKIVFVSNHLKDHFVETYRIDQRKAVTIYNGVGLDAYQGQDCAGLRRELGLDSSHILIGSVGNIRESKGYVHLLHAAAKVVSNHPECRFVIVGEGQGQLFNDLIILRKTLVLDDKVFFLGYRNNIPEILKSLDIFVLPSTSEGFSIVTLEAMASQVPMIVTKSGGPEEIVSRNSSILVSPGNVDELAEGIAQVIVDSRLRDKLVQNAYNTLLSKFDVIKMVNNYDMMYKLCLSRY